MAKIYPYGYFASSKTNLTDASGNYVGSEFKVPAFLNAVVLDNFSGNIVSGELIVLRNGTDNYHVELGVERDILVEPGDSFRFIVRHSDPSNIIYTYQLGLRYSKEYEKEPIELSESSVTVSTSSESSTQVKSRFQRA